MVDTQQGFINPGLTALTIAMGPALPDDLSEFLSPSVPVPDVLFRVPRNLSPPMVVDDIERGLSADIGTSGVGVDTVARALLRVSHAKGIDRMQIPRTPATTVLDPVTMALQGARQIVQLSASYKYRSVPLSSLLSVDDGGVYGTVVSAAGAPWNTSGTAKDQIEAAAKAILDATGIGKSKLSMALWGDALAGARLDPRLGQQLTNAGGVDPDIEMIRRFHGLKEVQASAGKVLTARGPVDMYPNGCALIFYSGDPIKRVSQDGDIMWSSTFRLPAAALAPWYQESNTSNMYPYEEFQLTEFRRPDASYLITNIFAE